MKPEDIKTLLGEHWKKTVGYIHSSLESDIDMLQKVNESILSHSGKQLRPLLSLLVAMACSDGKPTENTYRFAAASEMLHNATLLHDDVADDSDQRRGVPTIKSLMGPSVSVLLGDYWLVKAMELILSGDEGNRVMRLFSGTLSDLTDGEMLQLQKAEKGDTGIEDYTRIIYNKTASLFVVACLSAAISVGADGKQEEAVTEYATALGLAFQIRDDIFDYSMSAEVGKPTGVDILEQKITLPLLGAFKNAPNEESRIRNMVACIHESPEYRDEILAFVKDNRGVDYAESVLQGYVNKAVSALDALPDSWYKERLAELAVYVGQRFK